MLGGGRVWGPRCRKFPWASLPAWLPRFFTSTPESTSYKPSLGGNNETPVSPMNRFSFHSTVLIVEVSRCSRSPSPVSPSPLPVVPVLPLVPGSVQGNSGSHQPSAV